MSVATQNNFQAFQGDGNTTVFTWAFQVPVGDTGSDIQVFVVDNLGNVTLLTSNYLLNMGASKVTYPVTPGQAPLQQGMTALPAGWQLFVYRIEPLQQSLALTTQGSFPAAAIGAALDNLEFQIQQLQEQINRCIKYPIGQVPTTTAVNAFIAAIGAAIMSPPPVGTYAYLKGIAALNPAQWTFGIATDQGAAGENQLFFYSGAPSIGDGGWFGPIGG